MLPDISIKGLCNLNGAYIRLTQLTQLSRFRFVFQLVLS